jgi:hypothetical protein
MRIREISPLKDKADSVLKGGRDIKSVLLDSGKRNIAIFGRSWLG